VILTTHYLEEAEALCGRIAMLKEGRVVTLDSTSNLLARFAGQTLNLRLVAPGDPAVRRLRERATASNGTWTLRSCRFRRARALALARCAKRVAASRICG
jgi:ABC-2 type transport system ATP-binding protein